MVKVLFFVFVVCTMIMPAGCAKKQQVKQEYSGFLQNYPTFEPGPEGGAKLVYFKEGIDFSTYNKVMMDHVVFYLSDDAKDKGIQPDTMKELSDVFHEAVIEELKDAYPIVDEPGADVMRIWLAITELVPGKPGITLVTTAMPGGSAVKVIKYAATGSHSFVGETAMEAEVLDSLTNQRIAAAIDRRGKVKTIKITEGMTKWGETKDVFKFWAKRLRIWLDETHGIEPKK
jgi:hypothetical protein